MNDRTEKKLDAYLDGALSARQRAKLEARLDAEPGLREHVGRTRALGSMVREAWTEGPPAPSPESLITALRPAMKRIDAERAEASPWNRLRQRVAEWLGPIPITAFAGAAALVVAVVYTGLPEGDLSKQLGAKSGPAATTPRFAAIPEPAPGIVPVATTLNPTPTPQASVYDLAQGESPLMLFESEEATVIWVLPNDGVSAIDAGGWA